MSTETLFPEKDLIDLGFLEHLRFNTFAVESKSDADKALHELSTIKGKMKELTDIQDKLYKSVNDRVDHCKANLLIASHSIAGAITSFYTHNPDNLEFNENNEAVIQFEHGEIVIKKILDVKVKPKK